MIRCLLPFLVLPTFASCAQSQSVLSSTKAPSTKAPPFRALIIAGGPTPEENQYAIESNARYLEKLTSRAALQRILFADGKRDSRTISTLQVAPDADEHVVFAWLWEEEPPAQKLEWRSTKLKRLDGAATRQNVLGTLDVWAKGNAQKQSGLLFFTGHGTLGQKLSAGGSSVSDAENTRFSLWDDDSVSAREVAGALKSWPSNVPLVLVMVQCHAGGFANVLWENGDPKNPVWNRDFCGFFASTGARAAAGCTPEIDEINYQDFTTHFFAALSGQSREGRTVTGADFDKNGTVSMLEAFAHTGLRDNSIDVPVCTSDQFLRQTLKPERERAWLQTPYSSIVKRAAPWQRALLEGLSRDLKLNGDTRLNSADRALAQTVRAIRSDSSSSTNETEADQAVETRFENLKTTMRQRFPHLRASAGSAQFARAKRDSLRWLRGQRAEVAFLSRAARAYASASEQLEVREAKLLRFLRTANTLVLEQQLATRGTPAQKAVFARLRRSESRNPLR